MKLYYTCEHEANYMAKHHNLDWKQSSDTNHNFEVLPESHAIFEPQVGDLINDGGYFGVVCGIEDNITIDDVSFMCGDEHYYADEGFTIIQRNNKAFFMPLREE
jgi:hypothetical protein